jgi:hypothetical protein
MRKNPTARKKLTKRQKEILTHLHEKIVHSGMVAGAHRNCNWHTNENYENSDVQRMKGVLDRIGKVTYHKSPHVHWEKGQRGMNTNYIGGDFYDHCILCHWRELIGMGSEKPVCSVGGEFQIEKQDVKGRWHFPCDEGMWVRLWHPKNQPLQERVHECWELIDGPHWRPTYKYSDEEVIDALRIMSETFNWEFEVGGDMTSFRT